MKQGNEREIFAHNIAWLRKEHGFSKKHMAAVLGIGVRSLSAIERGGIAASFGRGSFLFCI